MTNIKCIISSYQIFMFLYAFLFPPITVHPSYFFLTRTETGMGSLETPHPPPRATSCGRFELQFIMVNPLLELLSIPNISSSNNCSNRVVQQDSAVVEPL